MGPNQHRQWAVVFSPGHTTAGAGMLGTHLHKRSRLKTAEAEDSGYRHTLVPPLPLMPLWCRQGQIYIYNEFKNNLSLPCVRAFSVAVYGEIHAAESVFRI